MYSARRTFALILTLALAGVGVAHSELESSTPAANATLQTAPSEVSLSFSEAAEVRFSTFKVYPLGADIDSADAAEAQLNGLAGQLMSEVLETQGDDDMRADTGVSTAPTTGARTAETVTLPLKPDLPAGVYVVMWRVLSVDTHTSQGFITFQVAP